MWVLGEPIGQAHREQHVGEFGLGVGGECSEVVAGDVFAGVCGGVSVCFGGEVDDPALFGAEEAGQQEVGEQEVAEVVHRHGHLHVHLVDLAAVHHHARVVNQHIDHLEATAHFLREPLDRLPLGKVQLEPSDAAL